ncbi:Fc.00g060140.m01.CDS01 [Cosmosporella sp. VM-42]
MRFQPWRKSRKTESLPMTTWAGSTETPVLGNGGVPHRKKILIFLILSLVSLTQAFDATCICVCLPTIAQELKASTSESLSLGIVFLLGATGAQPIFIEFSDVIGRKSAYLVALVTFIVGTVVCGAATNTMMLLAGRGIQGFGAGGPLPLGALILTDMFTLRERSKWISFLNVSWALGTISGPLIGGVFTQNEQIGWRWTFWLNLPFLVLSFIGAYIWLDWEVPPEKHSKLLKPLDWTGMLVFIISSVAFLLPMVWGGARCPWMSPQVIAPLCVSFVGFAFLGAYERLGAHKPMFRKSIFNNQDTCFQFVNTVVHGALMWMVLYYMSLFYLGVKHLSPFMTGVWALPATFSVAPMAICVGLVVSKTAVFGIMILVDSNMPTWQLLTMSAAMGIAFGSLIPAMSVGVQATVAREDAGHAIGMTYILRSAGQCLGVAIGLGVFSTRLETELEILGRDPKTARDMMRRLRNSLKEGGQDDAENLGAVVRALETVWATGCALAGVATILAFLTYCPPLVKESVRTDTDTGARIFLRNGYHDHGSVNERRQIWWRVWANRLRR